MDFLFFELIRVAIGTQDAMPRIPTESEWEKLLDMAEKQSMIGICFVGLINLGANSDDGFTKIGMSEDLYLDWMGTAAQINMMNELVNQQCVELQKRLASDGFRSSILKGQGVAALYGEELRGFRQSGDIDLYVDCGMERAMEYLRKCFQDVKYDYINAHVPVYDDTEVELHWRAQALTNVVANRRLQKWLKEHEEMIFAGKAEMASDDSIVVPSAEFNAFYILLHCYHHMFESGLGLRQLMDYYFVLKQAPKADAALGAIEQFGMKKFASGVMWIMKEVFGLPEEKMICEASEKEGEFLLKEVMQNGNFGHHDERIKKVGNGKMGELWRNLQHNWHLASHYPAELIWQPVWLAYHWAWKRFGKH